jgi:hypothetical protein
MWTFFCYDDGQPKDLWQTWYDGLDGDTKGRHDVALDFLEVRENHEWYNTPHFGELVPDEGIYEIRIRGKIQWRLAGYFSPNKEFTIVLICNHKQNVYNPRNAKKTAVKRRKQIESGSKTRKLCVRPS